MVKIRIRTGRGTKIIEVDSDATKWTGTQFKAIQAARKKAATDAGVKYITSGRGTGRKKLADTPEPKDRIKYKGRISSGRGTGSRKS